MATTEAPGIFKGYLHIGEEALRIDHISSVEKLPSRDDEDKVMIRMSNGTAYGFPGYTVEGILSLISGAPF